MFNNQYFEIPYQLGTELGLSKNYADDFQKLSSINAEQQGTLGVVD